MRWLLDILNLHSGARQDLVDATEHAIERVVDGTEPKLRLISGYKNKLRKEISGALSFIDKTVDRIPGPLDVQRKNYVRNPELAAYFSSPDEISQVINSSPELKTFFGSSHHITADEAYAMMCVQREEKQIMGMEIGGHGGQLRRDVLQTAVNFSDHKLLSAAETEAGVRDGIKQCIFDGLITYALEHLTRLKSKRKELEDERRILLSRLRSRQAKGNGLSKLLVEAYNDENLAEIDRLESNLSVTEKKLDAMPGHHQIFDCYLEEIRRIFARPDDFIHMNLACFRLNDMGIKVEDAADTANTVCFSELEIASVLKRVVTLVRLPRSEMI